MEPAREDGGERESSRRWPTWAKVLLALCIAGPVCLVTLGLLAMLVVPNLAQKIFIANTTKAKVDIATIARAADDYAVRNNGRYPADLEVLVVPDVNGATFLGRTSLPFDPWGRAYGYELRSGDHGTWPYIFTYGADGQRGGEGENRDIDSEMIWRGEI